MDETVNVDTNRVNDQIANTRTASPPPEYSTPASASVLSNAKNTRIKNSSLSIINNIFHFNALHVFVAFFCVFLSLFYSPIWRDMWWTNENTGVDITTKTARGLSLAAALDPLHKWVAPNAILNTGGRADEVRCHPGTREEVIGLIESFMDAQDDGKPRMLWLSGPAGAGKTAIMQTVAERSKERGVPHANFFFFRTDSSRRTAAPFVATLIHQIVQIYPSLGNTVAAALAANPLLFQMGLQQQVDTLMHLPFTESRYPPSTPRPVVLLIDGLDECDSEGHRGQAQILQALDSLLTRERVSFRVVIASRVEPQIVTALKQIHSHVDAIFLDENYSPEKDIRLFVTAEFDKIKSTHYLAHMLDQDWPADADIDDIVTKSSGQFVYAASVMRFLAHSHSSPALSLQRIHGIGPSVKNPPFAHLDAFYTYILEQVDDWNTVKSVLSCTFVEREIPTIKTCMQVHYPDYSDAILDSSLGQLTSIAQIRQGQMRHNQILPHGVLEFFHGSFPDFLKDESRAGRFYIDLPEFSTGILPKIWPAVNCDRVDVQIFARIAFVRIQRPTPEITALFMDPDQSRADYIEYGWKAVEYLVKINKHYDLYDHRLPIDILTIWMSAVRYLVMKNTAFDCNDRQRLVVDWKFQIEQLDNLLGANPRQQLSG